MLVALLGVAALVLLAVAVSRFAALSTPELSPTAPLIMEPTPPDRPPVPAVGPGPS
jgi:hypothetical protein